MVSPRGLLWSVLGASFHQTSSSSSAMRRPGLILALLVILGAISVDHSSTGSEVKNKIKYEIIKDDTLNGEVVEDLDFDRKKKPGTKSVKNPRKKSKKKKGKKDKKGLFKKFKNTAFHNFDREISNLSCSSLEDFQSSYEGCVLNTYVECLYAGYKEWKKCEKTCYGDNICTLTCVKKKIDQRTICKICIKPLLKALCCHFIGGECCINGDPDIGDICCHIQSAGQPASSTVPIPEEKKEFNTVVVENGQIVEQKDTFDPNTGEVSLSVPAHGNVEEATIIMDADSKVLMRSTETACHIESIPDEVNLDDIKTKEDEESTSTEPITEDTEKKSYSLVFDAGTASADEITELSPTMAKECVNKTIKKTEESKVDKETFDKFVNGDVITLELGKRRRRDTSSCDNPAKVCVSRPLHGCWRWPYGSGDSLHSISGNGFCVPCCNSTTSAADLCSCSELTSLEKIEQCLGSVGKNGTCPNGFENVCGQCLVDTDVGENISDCGGSCPSGRYLCGDECWPTWMNNNLVECPATGKCQDKRKRSAPPCNGTCLGDSFLCGDECLTNRYKKYKWDCNGTCQDKSIPCDNSSCPEGRFFCESHCHRDSYKRYAKICDGNCIWNTKPCNGTCDEGYTLCNNDDLFIDYYEEFGSGDGSDDYGYNYVECMDSSKIWNCDGKCHDKSKACDGKCDEGYTLCNARDVTGLSYGEWYDIVDKCFPSSSIWKCNGSCRDKLYPCNGTCDKDYILCDGTCHDLNYSSKIWKWHWNCSGKCQSKRDPCNGTCDEGYTLCNDKCQKSRDIWYCNGRCQYKSDPCNGTCPYRYVNCNGRCQSGYVFKLCLGQCIYSWYDCIDTCQAGNITLEAGETMEIDCKLFNCTVVIDDTNWQSAVLVTKNVTTTECIDSE